MWPHHVVVVAISGTKIKKPIIGYLLRMLRDDNTCDFFQIMWKWKKIKSKFFRYGLMVLELKITCTCHPIAPKIRAGGFATCWIQIYNEICSPTTPGIRALKDLRYSSGDLFETDWFQAKLQLHSIHPLHFSLAIHSPPTLCFKS